MRTVFKHNLLTSEISSPTVVVVQVLKQLKGFAKVTDWWVEAFVEERWRY